MTTTPDPTDHPLNVAHEDQLPEPRADELLIAWGNPPKTVVLISGITTKTLVALALAQMSEVYTEAANREG